MSELTPERIGQLLDYCDEIDDAADDEDDDDMYDAILGVDELRALLAAHAREKRLRELLRGVLLFHSGGGWTVEMQADWLRIFGEADATTGVMGRAIRKALEADDDK